MGNGLKTVAAQCGGLVAKSGANVVKYTAKGVPRKERTDKGRRHKPGAGRPEGRAEDKALRARMTNLDKWLTANAACIKPNGVAGLAGVTAPDLSKMRSGDKPLQEAVVAELEKAAARFKYNPKSTY